MTRFYHDKSRLDLAVAFGPMSELRAKSGGKRRALTADLLPSLPLAWTDKIIVIKGLHDYGSIRADLLYFQATKPAYRELGLFIVSSLLHQQRCARLKLTHPKSEIKEFAVEPSPRNRKSHFYYQPATLSMHPWAGRRLRGESFPHLSIDESGSSITCSGEVQGVSNFAKLLLDISQPHCRSTEVQLECEAGFRGVAPGSAEVRLCLPGSGGWFADWWADVPPKSHSEKNRGQKKVI